MTIRIHSILQTATAAGIVALAATYSLRAAPQPIQAVDPLAALLSEVHALRIAMEQNATLTPRLQLTLARLNIEEQRVAQLAAQLDRARQELNGNGMALRRMSGELEAAEKRLQMTVEDKPSAGTEQASRARENDALQALSIEQGRWLDLNSRLDELERLLAPIPR